ncbi:MAG TPA: hypothetical protein VLJ58_10670 [Ramlibacter sp.]|nr:hypothetical protein [Ramlibacter sp.]
MGAKVSWQTVAVCEGISTIAGVTYRCARSANGFAAKRRWFEAQPLAVPVIGLRPRVLH